MINRHWRAHQLHRTESVLGSREKRGMQQAHPQQNRNQAGLCSSAESEFRPRSPRLRKRGEESLLRSRITHDYAYSIQYRNTLSDSKVPVLRRMFARESQARRLNQHPTKKVHGKGPSNPENRTYN